MKESNTSDIHWKVEHSWCKPTTNRLFTLFIRDQSKASPRQLRHLDFIGQFTTAIKHISGENNVVADTFSRIDEVYTPSIIEPEELAEQQESDPQLKDLLSTNTTGLKLNRLTPSHNGTHPPLRTSHSTEKGIRHLPQPVAPKWHSHAQGLRIKI
jgi:hypothetical protein